jgi:hypothetical protein
VGRPPYFWALFSNQVGQKPSVIPLICVDPFYIHALTEAKKDGIGPEDAVRAVLTGEVIEEYPDRQRVLMYAMLPGEMPLHGICDYSQADALLIVIVYVPDDGLWVGFKRRRKGK